MSDIERKAKELLAYECPECGGENGHDTDDGWIPCSRCSDPYTVTRHQAMQAIIAAFTPPEGYVLIKADTLADLANDAEALIVQTEFRRDRIDGKLASVREARAMLAPRPEVK